MNERIQTLAEQVSLSLFNDTAHYRSLPGFSEKFAEFIIGHASECVRDVLREEGSTLSYEDASKIQNRIKEFFGVK
jgi:hypothetical protein